MHGALNMLTAVQLSPINVGGELHRLNFRNTVHVVFSRQNSGGNRGRVQGTRSLCRTMKHLRVKMCTSSDGKNKSLLKAGAKADAGD